MRLVEVVDCLACEVLAGRDQLDREIDCCFAADLMSDVLAYAQHGGLLITGLSTAQSVHTAEIADLGAVVLVRGKRPAEEVVAFATRRGLPLLLTPHSMFDACGLLYQRGLRLPLAGGSMQSA
jgi:predicted transcriptional regulator